MQPSETSTRFVPFAAAVIGAAALTFATGLILTGTTRSVEARPAFSSQTGFPCGRCHTNPPQLSDYGRQFKANGNKVK
jgi:hypothetical protein